MSSAVAEVRAEVPDSTSAVRPEYQALVDHFPALLHDLGTRISTQALSDLTVLMAAIEHVDRSLDPIADAGDRNALIEITIATLGGLTRESETHDVRDAALTNRPWRDAIERRPGVALQPSSPMSIVCPCAGDDSWLDSELVARLQTLRTVATRLGVRGEVAALTAETLANTERMRDARDRASYLDCVEREGELCVELALLIGGVAHLGAIAFLRAVASPANLLDKLLDLRGDHRRGEVAVDPGVRTHLWLAARLLQRSWSAARAHPSLPRFGLWGARWLIRMTR